MKKLVVATSSAVMAWPALVSNPLAAQSGQMHVIRSGDPGYADMMRKIAASDAQWDNVTERYERPPSFRQCDPGELKTEFKTEFLGHLNALRARHKLSPVSYAPEYDAETSRGALMLAVRGQLSHYPTEDWECYDAQGAIAAQTSNLSGGAVSPYLIWSEEDEKLSGWLREHASASIGHRRWLLNPFLQSVSYGRVSFVHPDNARTDATVLKVFGFPDSPGQTSAVPAVMPDFVAYPFGDYPARYFQPDDRMSFSVIASPQSAYASSKVDFSAARVVVTCEDRQLGVSSMRWDNEGFGLANSLEWRVNGLSVGDSCTVTITGVRNAPKEEYAYDFRIAE